MQRSSLTGPGIIFSDIQIDLLQRVAWAEVAPPGGWLTIHSMKGEKLGDSGRARGIREEFGGQTMVGGEKMDKKHRKLVPEDLRLSPQNRLCNKFDEESIAKFPVAQPGEMGFRVVDNCAEEHMM